MNKDWAELLISSGKVTSAGSGMADELSPDDFHFEGDSAAITAESVCDLSADVIVKITGDDAESFLQGQFSNDVAKLTVPSSQLTTWSTPKGRVLALFRLYRLSEGFLLKLPREQADSFIKRLRMFVLRAKVEIELLPDQLAIGVSGSAEKVIELTGLSLPQEVDACTTGGDLLVCRVRSGSEDRFEMVGPLTDIADRWSQLSAKFAVCSQARWRLHNIDAGLPSVNAATAEAFVLQMLNLQHIDGVSFKKGCFPGQEVVARMQYLGKLKRRMFRCSVDGEAPKPGAELFSDESASAVGKVVDGSREGQGESRFLAVIAIDATVKPLTVDQRPLTLLDLPYELPEPT